MFVVSTKGVDDFKPLKRSAVPYISPRPVVSAQGVRFQLSKAGDVHRA